MSGEGLSLAAAVSPELPAPASGAVPEWIELFRPGWNHARDGRRFLLKDPKAVIAASLTPGAELPVDYDHQTERPDAIGPVPAAGWITELAERNGGIWARVSWTRDAAALIASRAYRYISPAFLLTRSGEVRAIKGAGLVHWPALNLTQLAGRSFDMTDHAPDDTTPADAPLSFDRAELAALLGLDAAAVTAAAVTDRLAAARPDPARFVPIDAVRELLASHVEARQALTEAEVAAKVEAAQFAGHLTPGMRPWALELCRADPEAFDAFVATSPAPYRAMFDRPTPLQRAQAAAQRADRAQGMMRTDAEAEICRQLGIRPQDLAD